MSHDQNSANKKPLNLAFEDQFVDYNDRNESKLFRRNSSCPSLEENKQTKGMSKNVDKSKILDNNKSDFYMEPINQTPNRDAILKLHMSKCREDYTKEQEYKVFVGSWNVNGQSICEDLSAWLGDYPPDSSRPADIVALGFQELDLRTEAYIFYESHRESEWLLACDICLRKVVDQYNRYYGLRHKLPHPPVRRSRRGKESRDQIPSGSRPDPTVSAVERATEALGSSLLAHGQRDESNKGYERTDFPLDIKDSAIETMTPFSPYVKLHLIRLVGIMMVVFVKTDVLPFITDVASESIGTGLLGKMGNKGGVAIRFNLHGTPICFVNTHFAAHPDELEKRNQDFQDISNRIQFSKCAYIGILDHDYIFWFGDLNYRIDIANQENAKAQITNNQISDLMKYDQLLKQKKLGRIFSNFEEGQITFPPTYKYDPGTDVFDTSEKARVPSWCDRILWKCNDASKITLICYRSHPLMRMSDHKPVSALFSIKLQVIDEVKFKKAYEFVMKNIDRIENDYLPQATLDKMEVDFGDTHFMQHNPRVLYLTNVGQVPIQFQFIKKPGSRNYCKSWISIKPFKYLGSHFVNPKNRCAIDFVCYITKLQAPLLNSMVEKLEDILILHLENGKDFFISVTGNYVKSCFGASLEELAEKGNRPYRRAVEKPLIDIDDDDSILKHKHTGPSFLEAMGSEAKNHVTKGPHGSTFSTVDVNHPIPTELWIMAGQILERGIKEPDLFQKPGIATEILIIRDSLDLGTPAIRDCSVYSICDALLIFLEALQTPIFPVELYDTLFFLPEPLPALDQGSIDVDANHHDQSTTTHTRLQHQHHHHARMKAFPQTREIMKQMPVVNRDTFKFLLSFLQCLLDYSSYNGLNYDLLSSIFSRVLIREVASQTLPKSFKTAPSPLNIHNSNYAHSHNARELSIQDQYILDKKRKALFTHLLMNS